MVRKINVEMFMQIAKRVEAQAKSIAGYSQNTFCELSEPRLDRVKNECDTTCCIAGHAFILARGEDDYVRIANTMLFTNLISAHFEHRNMAIVARDALGISERQADALFGPLLIVREIVSAFGLDPEVYDRELQHEGDVADLLRGIALTHGYEREEK